MIGSSLLSSIFSWTGVEGGYDLRIDFEDWHSLEGGRDLIEVSASVQSLETVQGEKSTFFLSFPDPASEEVTYEVGEGLGVSVANPAEE
jgi:hypothetical protein